MRADWKPRVDFACCCVVAMRQYEIHSFDSKPDVSGWLFYDSAVLNGKKVKNPRSRTFACTSTTLAPASLKTPAAQSQASKISEERWRPWYSLTQKQKMKKLERRQCELLYIYVALNSHCDKCLQNRRHNIHTTQRSNKKEIQIPCLR